MPDLSGVLGEQLDKAIARAEKLAAARDAAGARKAYLRASEIALRYAKSAPTKVTKQRRLERAKALQAKADAVAQERVRSRGKGAVPGEAEEEADADREQVQRLIQKGCRSWEDVAGLDAVKSELQTAYVMAMAKAPSGVKLSPSRTILLYGPPGTGKTILAEAVSSQLDATFFNIRTGDLLSSLFGKSPQLVTAVFEEAAERAPSVIFFDEVEALAPSRDHDISSADSRVVSAFLQGLGGFRTDPDAPFVLAIGATNKPWSLDHAFLSRFARMVYVPLPDRDCRAQIVRLNLDDNGIPHELSTGDLADLTEGYSGREIVRVCEEAVASAIRSSNPAIERLVREGLDAVAEYELQLDPIAPEHFREALTKIRPVVDDATLARYTTWAQQQDT